MPKEENETYIGDGVYARFDGYQIWLRAPRGDSPDHEIALEQKVFYALVWYASEVWPLDIVN